MPSFDSKVAMLLLEDELGGPWTQFYSQLTPKPIAAASLGQVYKGRLLDGTPVAVKVQRPHVVETVSVDLFIIRCPRPPACPTPRLLSPTGWQPHVIHPAAASAVCVLSSA